MENALLMISFFLATSCYVHVGALHEGDYDFHKTLDSAGKYELSWGFDLGQENISFAVRVQTTGWIGFGLSPNGQMPNSDIVMGWVDDSGKGYLQDRFADFRATPAIDTQQDWELTGAEEENGYTTLQFTRKLVTCDDRDLDIMADTTRIIWSYFPMDPDDSNGPFSKHSAQGTKSINLLSGIPHNDISEPSDMQSFKVQVENLLVPNETDTTYWCASFDLSTVTNEKIYIHKFSPYIPEHAAAYVHHMGAYLCPLGHSLPRNLSSNCFDARMRDVILPCNYGRAEILGVWAVGGEEFVFPKGIALPVREDDLTRHILLSMHYDNPLLAGDVFDSSGLEFFYTTTPPREEAGAFIIGFSSWPAMFIPPKAKSFRTRTVCSADCLSQYLPEEGINVFANLLHTHLLGYGLTLHHITNTEQCGATEELKPIDQNLKYDFDYQQLSRLRKEVTVKPGDSLELTCLYRSSGTNRTSITLAGLGTPDEMCLSFLYYYPRTNLSSCFSAYDPFPTYQNFVASNIEDNTQAELLFQAMELNDEHNISQILNTVEWNADTVQELQDAIDNASLWQMCYPHYIPNVSYESAQPAKVTNIDCSYEAPSYCTGSTPLSCCERLKREEPLSPSSSPTPDAAGKLATGVTSLLVSLVITVVSFN